MPTRINRTQEIDNSLQKQELEALVNLFAIYLPNPSSVGSWLAEPTYTLTAVDVSQSHLAYSVPNANFSDPTKKPFNFIIKGKKYQFDPIPIEIDGIEYTSESAMPHPMVTIGNINLPGWKPESLLGAKFQYIQTFQKYVNTDTSLPVQTFIIDSIKEETFSYIQYELVAPYDLQDVKLPRRRIVGGQCPWIYKGASEKSGRHNFIATDAIRGGCNWPDDNIYVTGGQGRASLLFMNSNDEYVVDARLIPLATRNYAEKPADQGITAGQYFYTISSSYKLDSQGLKDPNLSIVYQYWQAMKTVTFDQPVDEPSADSPFWRQVRVYKPYNYTNTYCAYSDSRFNDYVSLSQGGTTVNNAGLASLVEGYEFVEPEPINEIIPLDSFSEVLDNAGGKALRLAIDPGTSLEILANYIADVEYSTDDMGAYINTRTNTAVGSFAAQPGTDQTWLNLVAPIYNSGLLYSKQNIQGWGMAPGQVVLVDETNLNPAYNSIKAGTDYSLWIGLGANTVEETNGLSGFLSPEGEFLSLWMHTKNENTQTQKQIYQVKNKTLDPNKLSRLQHGPFPPRDTRSFNYENWNAGDQCSKTLDACVLRFQSAALAVEEDESVNTNFDWNMTPRYSDDASGIRNIYYMATLTPSYDFSRGAEGQSGVDLLGRSPVVRYLRCDDDVLYNSLPDEGFVNVEMYIDGQYRTNYPYYKHNKTGQDNYLDDGNDVSFSGSKTGSEYTGAMGHKLSPRLNLPDMADKGFGDYYYIKLAPQEDSTSPGTFTPGWATFTEGAEVTTASGREVLFHPDRSIRSGGNRKLGIGVDGSSYNFTFKWSGSENPAQGGTPSQPHGLIMADIDVLGVENEGAVNGLFLISMAGLEAETAPFEIDRFDNMTEGGMGMSPRGYLGDIGVPDVTITASGSGEGVGTFLTGTKNNAVAHGGASSGWTVGSRSWTQPVLRDKDDNAIANGTIDPSTGQTYKFRFSNFTNLGNTPLSPVLQSQIALPFGGFPGSRRFK